MLFFFLFFYLGNCQQMLSRLKGFSHSSKRYPMWALFSFSISFWEFQITNFGVICLSIDYYIMKQKKRQKEGKFYINIFWKMKVNLTISNYLVSSLQDVRAVRFFDRRVSSVFQALNSIYCHGLYWLYILCCPYFSYDYNFYWLTNLLWELGFLYVMDAYFSPSLTNASWLSLKFIFCIARNRM